MPGDSEIRLPVKIVLYVNLGKSRVVLGVAMQWCWEIHLLITQTQVKRTQVMSLLLWEATYLHMYTKKCLHLKKSVKGYKVKTVLFLQFSLGTKVCIHSLIHSANIFDLLLCINVSLGAEGIAVKRRTSLLTRHLYSTGRTKNLQVLIWLAAAVKQIWYKKCSKYDVHQGHLEIFFYTQSPRFQSLNILWF